MDLGRSPILGPLLILLKSTRFLTAIIAIILGIVVALVPELQAYEDELFLIIGGVAVALIGGHSYTEGHRLASERSSGLLELDLNKRIQEAVDAAFNNLTPTQIESLSLRAQSAPVKSNLPRDQGASTDISSVG